MRNSRDHSHIVRQNSGGHSGQFNDRRQAPPVVTNASVIIAGPPARAVWGFTPWFVGRAGAGPTRWLFQGPERLLLPGRFRWERL